MQRIILAVLVASIGTVASAQAQRPHTTRLPSRFFINGHSVAAFGTSVTPEGWDALKTSTGLGGGVQIGYAITPRLTAYAGYEIAKQPVDMFGLEGDFGLSHLEAGAHLSFPVKNSRLSPYVGAWVGRRSLTSTLDDLDNGHQPGLLAQRHGGRRERRDAVLPDPRSRPRRRRQPRHGQVRQREDRPSAADHAADREQYDDEGTIRG